jgi:hypothetical protein
MPGKTPQPEMDPSHAPSTPCPPDARPHRHSRDFEFPNAGSGPDERWVSTIIRYPVPRRSSGCRQPSDRRGAARKRRWKTSSSCGCWKTRWASRPSGSNRRIGNLPPEVSGIMVISWIRGRRGNPVHPRNPKNRGSRQPNRYRRTTR